MSTAAASGPTNIESAPLQNIVDRNTLVWWGLLLISILLGVTLTPWGCLFWLVAIVLDDMMLYGFGRSIAVGMPRTIVDEHFPSNVILGALLGTLVGLWTNCQARQYAQPKGSSAPLVVLLSTVAHELQL